MKQLRDELSKQETDFLRRARRPDFNMPSTTTNTSQGTVEVLDSRVQDGAEALADDRHRRQAQEILGRAKVVRVEVHLEAQSGGGGCDFVRSWRS